MMNVEYLRCNALPAISETFPQFSRPLTLPLDLSQRVSNAIPITPPSTPSPPKRLRLMSDENQQLWRPHALRASSNLFLDSSSQVSSTAMATNTVYNCLSAGDYFDNSTYAQTPVVDYKSNLHDIKHNFAKIPDAQRSVKQPPTTRRQQCELPIMYVDEETIVLTEDEDETVVSSHECADKAVEIALHNTESNKMSTNAKQIECEEHDEEEEEYVDILGNDDDDEANLLSANSILQQQCLAMEHELEKSDKVLTRNKLIYDDEELHKTAIIGLDKLFERDFEAPLQNELNITNFNVADKNDTERIIEKQFDKSVESLHEQEHSGNLSLPEYSHTFPLSYNNSNNNNNMISQGVRLHHKPDRKRVKLRKHQCVDEETVSPVSGTIIRKLRDDEELVVRKGDIDPAFNVVEITDEAKAILASIDNKIGAYLCQLCRTLYDDAFMLAQHRCPRIVHIEYKCSECEKVFNCPANLASHKRWHKPKAEITSSQNKKRQMSLTNNVGNITGDYNLTDDGADGSYACTQCNKVFRRQAYLRKHEASHEIMEKLKPLDLLNKSSASLNNLMGAESMQPKCTDFSTVSTHRPTMGNVYPTQNPYHMKQYQKQFGSFPFPQFDQRRFYSLGQLYLSQHFERSSAFQYVPVQHLRTPVPGSMLAPLLSMPVK